MDPFPLVGLRLRSRSLSATRAKHCGPQDKLTIRCRGDGRTLRSSGDDRGAPSAVGMPDKRPVLPHDRGGPNGVFNKIAADA